MFTTILIRAISMSFFGVDVCNHVLARYPQIRQINLTIDTPRIKDVAADRTESVIMTREAETILRK
jgi:hypothetical protein